MAKFSYPRGVIALSSVEMWERFSFYTMQSLLVLYATAKVGDGGLGWSQADALRLVGYYGALVYVSPIIGGVIADKLIGRKLAVLIGSIIMMFGHASLAYPGVKMMYLGLSLLIIGCGLMKPAISAMVGEFFKATETGRKDASFAIFYMSINIGGFLGPIIGGVVQETWGYDYAFAMAALGLAIGIINFSVTKNRSLKDVGNIINKAHHEKLPWTALEKKKVFTYILLCITNIFWNIIYVLPYGLLTLYAEKNIDRHLGSFTIPATWYYGMYGLLIIIYSPIVATMYQWIKNRTGSDMTLSWKLAYGYILVAGGCVILLPLVKAIGLNPNYVGSSWYIIGFYTLFCFSELLTLPVMLSAATTFAPHGFSATLVSLNMAISWAIGAWLGGEFGAWTQETNPVVLFWWLIALCLVFAVGHILSNKKIEKIMHS
ncbi:MAG: MFS transporter [Neisseriaceae bacterium]|nr:MAG: MFS transporter [Neisseriaceae bacterium]